MPGDSKKRTSSSDTKPAAKKSKTETPSKTPTEKKTTTPTQDGASKEFMESINQARLTAGSSIADFKFNANRMRVLSDKKTFKDGSGVLYWMNRDQRIQDNWAMLYAQKMALEMEVPLHVCFCLTSNPKDATMRHHGFMLRGLQRIERDCNKLDVSFHLLFGEAKDVLPDFVSTNDICGVVTDFSPLREPTKWVTELGEALKGKVALHQVDAHNIVPCWEASPKLEYGARTIRNKIHNLLTGKNGFLTEIPPVVQHTHKAKTKAQAVDWKAASTGLKVDRTVPEVSWAKAGSEEGLKMLETFVTSRLKNFSTDRNNPNKNALSNLSPWIHFGHVSVQRCIQVVSQHRSKYKESVDSFIEEAVIRRELADNFCFYNEHYDSVKGAYDWAKKSLKIHAGDKREYVYTKEELTESKTHDDLWNAAQLQLVQKGKMHGFLRMYWAKKILEWTESPKVALEIALHLNDRYSLDGRDPNGYVGCMWSICGIHDQGWMERPVFGKIRYMNYKGCQRKFDVAAFVKKYDAKAYKYTKNTKK